MTTKLLESITCPSCRNSKFKNIEFLKENELILEGALVCLECDDLFIMQNGILCLLPATLADGPREIEFIKKNKEKIPEKSFIKRITELEREEKRNGWEEWILYEKKYWDKKSNFKLTKRPTYSFNRSGVRNKHILQHIKESITNQCVIEFGAGFAETVYFDLNPQDFKFDYICTDISFKELLRARWLHKNATCVQCDATNPPFKDNTFDVILNFGALHHLPDNLKVLNKQIALLKPEGKMGIHEPINRREAFLSKYNSFKKLKKKQSVHNDFIDEKKTLELLKRYGKIENVKIEYSPIRSWLIKLVKDICRMNNRTLIELIIKLDDYVIDNIGKHINSFGGNAILVLWKKSK